MLQEFFQHLFAKESHWSRKSGLAKEQIAIVHRYRRNKDLWDRHYARCHQFLINSLENQSIVSNQHNETMETLAIFGAGLLHDVPLDYLSKKFLKIYAIDGVFLEQTKCLQKKYPKIQFIECDLSHWQKDYFDQKNPSPKFFNDFFKIENSNNIHNSNSILNSRLNISQLIGQCDAVFSMNILSQLTLLPTELMTKFGIQEDIQKTFCHKILKHHINDLLSLNPKICLLVTDFKQFIKETSKETGKNFIKNSTNSDKHQTFEHEFFNLLPSPSDQWDWSLAPRGELAAPIELTLRVGGYHIL